MRESKKNIEYLLQWESVRLELFKYILYFVRDENIAMDILQATTEISYIKYKAPMDGKIFKYQLLAIAKNKIFEYLRKEKREVSLNFYTENTLGKEDIGFDAVSDGQVSWYEIISSLKDFEQQLIVLRYKESLSYKDISIILGKSEGALRTCHHRIIRKLYKIILCESNKYYQKP